MHSFSALLSGLARNAISNCYRHNLASLAEAQRASQHLCLASAQLAAPQTISVAPCINLRHIGVNTSPSCQSLNDQGATCDQPQRVGVTPADQLSAPLQSHVTITILHASRPACTVACFGLHRDDTASRLIHPTSHLHVTSQHARRISSTVTYSRSPQTTPTPPDGNAAPVISKPPFSRQTPLTTQNRGRSASEAEFAWNAEDASAQGPEQQPSQQPQRPPFQRSPPFPRQPGAARPSMQQGKGPAHWQANAKGTAKPLEPQVKKMKANRDITAPEVRLVGADGSHQILSLADALKAAKDAKLDLVEVAGGAVPPVCRLLNHSQVSFEKKVKERKLEKLKLENRRTSVIKEVQFGANVAEHDMQVKLKKAKEFVEKGHRVKCTVKTKPIRGQGKMDGVRMLPGLKERMSDFADVSAPPATEKQTPNALSFYLAPMAQQKQA